LTADQEVFGNSIQISQVILNLLNNAFDAIQDATDKWIKIQTYIEHGQVQIRVTDCGHGISNEVAKKIMQPFFTTKPIGKGTGLGLSISKGIVEAHQGKLTIDTESKNTCFVITLPTLLQKGQTQNV
jgi:signal transduction histidine kinase